ncbi:tetratricopeptide repeat protein, partial [Ancylobacter lacus]|uniref:tetratricopeptide repeat protein n=1 Tax=Ancylobacter lacus TaxID=2579970 RepID=UPI001BCED624
MNEGWITYPALKRLGPEGLTDRLAAGPEAAARWVEAGALNGLVGAQIAWGQMLVDGTGVPRDPAAGLRWFRIAAETGDLDAITLVGRAHELGWGVAVDKAEAARHFARAAARGHVWAQFNLGRLLLEGDGVAPDRRAALGWLLRAAGQGHAKAMTLLGRYAEQGWEGRVRPAAALRWYHRAALGGDFRGQFDLGRLLAAQGAHEAAALWFARAVEGGFPAFCRQAGAGLRESGVPAFAAIARRALERACASGEPADLRAYAAALAAGLGGPAEAAEARPLLARANALEAAPPAPT